MSADTEEFIDNLVAAVNSRNIDRLVDCFAEDFVNTTPTHPARGFTGHQQVRQNWSAIFSAVPDITGAVIDQAVVGDTIWTEWIMDGMRRDGNEHHMRGIVVFTVAGRQATSARFYLEPLDVGTGDATAAIAAQLNANAS